MHPRAASAFDRLVGALCVALMMIYAAALPAKAAAQMQHAPALMVSHEHGGLDNFAIDVVHDSYDDHVGHHEDAPDDKGQSDDHRAAGHHHHGDTGPNLLAPAVSDTSGFVPPASLHDIGKDRPISGLRSIGPDRPPRTASLST
ncbi:hypothetical protein [Sphingopyxis sp.]|jgi:hypothetical protein|uniref:hypothetical protein n=1 Tax=Sphingopyxis sp. TaxID=1908224 RepID=UPI003F6F403F